MNVNDTVTLFRPVGPKELELIRASGNRAFPPRLSDMNTKDFLRLGVPLGETMRRATKEASTEDLITVMNKFILPLLALLAVAGWQPCYAQVPAAPRASSTAGPVPLSQNHAASKRMFNSWKTPLPPRHMIGNIHYVGPGGVSSWLITTPEGHILIDSTFEECVPQICTNVEKLGFIVSDIKLLLSSHAHVDHTGGHAAMKGRTGARIVASAADAHLLETGGADDFSPFPKDLLAYRPVRADRIVEDGDTVSLGGVTLTAHLTPGHTKGATTWTMPLKDGERTYQVVFFSSVSIAEPTRLLNDPAYPTIVEDYESTFKKLKALPCDIFLAPHADQFGLTAKLKGLDAGANPNPFIDPVGWKAFLTTAEQVFLKQLAAEKAAETKRQ
jgi:metallo-beta-lactamase class B